MNIREISDIFKDTADNITAIRSYNFGWASDRVRQGNTEDFQELNEFPRIFFAVPTITASDQTRKQDTYQVTIFFDDLLGYNNEGDEDPTLQIDKWANLQQYANYFVQRLNKIKQSILPNYLFIPEAPSITFDSFTGLQRMITVQLSFNLVVPTNCDPGVITLVQCIANIVTSSNLTASLTTVLKFAASLEGRATVTADINFVQKVASSLNANALLSGDISFVKNAEANLSALASLSGDINFVQKAQASLLTTANVTGNLTIPKTFNASLLATGTTTADLTVNAPSASLLLDLYPSAAAAYSLRKLRTAYSGSAIRVRRSSDNTEQDIGFVGNDLNTTALTTFVGAGNGFVTTWYDQSGNARNLTQTTQASQPQIVSSGVVILTNSKPSVRFNGTSTVLTGGNILPVGSNSLFVAQVAKPSTTATMAWYSKSIAAGSSGRYTLVQENNIVSSFVQQVNEVPPKNINLGSASTNRILINTEYIPNTSFRGYINNSEVASLTTGITTIGSNNITFRLGGYGNASDTETISFFNGEMQEFILYLSNQQSNRSAINTNINSNYAIY